MERDRLLVRTHHKPGLPLVCRLQWTVPFPLLLASPVCQLRPHRLAHNKGGGSEQGKYDIIGFGGFPEVKEPGVGKEG